MRRGEAGETVPQPHGRPHSGASPVPIKRDPSTTARIHHHYPASVSPTYWETRETRDGGESSSARVSQNEGIFLLVGFLSVCNEDLNFVYERCCSGS